MRSTSPAEEWIGPCIAKILVSEVTEQPSIRLKLLQLAFHGRAYLIFCRIGVYLDPNWIDRSSSSLLVSNEASTGLPPWYPSLSSAESAEAPSFAIRASDGPTVAFIHGLTPMVFCEGG